MKRILFALFAIAGAATAADTILINGAGATFPFPIYSKWFSEYNKAHPNVQINYQSIGSGGGIKQITEKTVDFGASDAPMNAEELQKAPGIQHIPTVMGAVVVIHNAPGVQDLKLTPETVAGIFLGKITQWNDPAIAAQNKGAKLRGCRSSWPTAATARAPPPSSPTTWPRYRPNGSRARARERA